MSQTMRTRSAWTQTLRSLSYRDFRLVWLGSLTEHLGEWMELTAFLWLARELTPSPFLLTFIGFARFIPQGLFPILGGMAADRVDRRLLLILSLAFASLLSIALWLLVYTGLISIWSLVVISLLIGVANSFNHPARGAIVPNLVRREHLLNAISLDLSSIWASAVVAAPIAGIIIDRSGVGPIFLLRALGAFLAIVWLLMVRIPLAPPQGQSKESPWQNLVGGLHYLRSQPMVTLQVALYLQPMIISFAAMFLLPVFAVDILGVKGTGFGLLTAASGLGALLSLIILASFLNLGHKGLLLLILGMVAGLSLWGFGASRWFVVSLFCLFVSGLTRTGFMTLNTTIIQEVIPDAVRGRIMGLREVAMGLAPLGGLAAGAIAQLIGAPSSVMLWGAITFAIPLALLLSLPKLRKMW